METLNQNYHRLKPNTDRAALENMAAMEAQINKW